MGPAWIVWALTGCAPQQSTPSAGDASMDGPESEEPPAEEAVEGLEGTVTAGTDLSGLLDAPTAFAAIAYDTLYVYASSTPGVTCEDILTSFEKGDPSGVMTPGTCNLFLLVQGYAGSLQAEDDPDASVSSAVFCAMGDGEWSTNEAGSNAWTGTWWQGYPVEYRWDFEGESPDDLVMDLEMTHYEGSFPYDMEATGPAPASGTVAGKLTPESCPDLASWRRP
jgi:hypothetical protein